MNLERIKIFLGWCPDKNRIYLENKFLTENVSTFMVKSLGIFAVFVLFACFLRGAVLYTLVWHSHFVIAAEKMYYLPVMAVLSLFSSFFGFLGKSTYPKRAVLYTMSVFVCLLSSVLILNHVIASNSGLLASWQTQPLLVKYMLRTYTHEYIVPLRPGIFTFFAYVSVPSIVYAFVISKWQSRITLVISSVVYGMFLPVWMDTFDSMILPTTVNLGYFGALGWSILYGLFIALWVILFEIAWKKVRK